MKSHCIAIALVGLVAACDRGSHSIVGPSAPPLETTPSGVYTLSGTVQESDGVAVSGAAVQLYGFSSSQTTLSGEGGEYRFDNVRGNTNLRVSKEGYVETIAFVYVAKNETLNMSLSRPLTLVPGTTLRGVVKAPPCDPQRWDSTALCERIAFTPPVTGRYELVLTWTGPSELDLLIDEQGYWSSTTGPIRALIEGVAGVARPMKIHSYYSPQSFELTATLQAAP
jgi:hypothetical protein